MNSSKTTIILSMGLLLIVAAISQNPTLMSMEMVQAQTNRSNYPASDVPIDDQARYLRGLKSRDSFEWDNPTSNNLVLNNSYQLNISEPDIRLVEQDIPEWRNTGEDSNYSVLVDVYKFREGDVIP